MRQKGFTLIEFIVVITITAVLALAITDKRPSKTAAMGKVKTLCQQACQGKGASLKTWSMKGGSSVACVCVKRQKE
jgi:prepilin-type N-terminal cleavage/methylation domain-containing protein